MMPAGHIYRNDPAGPGPLDTVVGGKAAQLLELEKLNQRVPPFYVITTTAFEEVIAADGLDQRIKRRLESEEESEVEDLGRLAADLRDWLMAIKIPAWLEEAVGEAHKEMLKDTELFAVRSSVVGEDSAEHSFAGIHSSVLCLNGADRLLGAIKETWASAFSERALVYRRRFDMPLDDIHIAVVVQRMVEAQRSGVMFSCNPTTGNPDEVVISSLWGAGEGVVGAGLATDTFVIDKKTREVAADIVEKTEQLVLDSAGVGRLQEEEVPEPDRNIGSLSDEQVEQVVEAGLAIEERFGCPQDIEFCIDADGRLFVLQSRPVTGVEQATSAAGNPLVWDNSNIIESYSGVTSPMTFSFIQRVYAIVYHCFVEVMGVSPRVVRANRTVFGNMLGLFRGRVYYNLKNWYRTLRMFPGFQYNSRFMEGMMGVNEPLDLEEERPPVGWLRRWFVELPALLRLLARSMWSFFRIRTLVKRFEANFHHHYDRWEQLDFDQMSPHELKALYDEMEDTLLWNWKAPIITDFYVMIYFGTLKKLCQSWCEDGSGSLANELISGEGGVESVAPARMVLQLARLAHDNPELRDLILEEPVAGLPAKVAASDRFASFNELMRTYLDLYGFRCMHELKLEEYSLRDRPEQVYQVIRNYLSLDNSPVLDTEAIEGHEQEIRKNAERCAFEALSRGRGILPRKVILRWVLRNARLGVKSRENMRFARTRIFGLLREMLRAIGRQLAREEIIDDTEDIFYLTMDEVWDYIKGTAVSTNLRELARLRRDEFAEYRERTVVPDDRFTTYGMAYHLNLFRDWNSEPVQDTDGLLRGVGCCPGVVTSPVKIVRNPADDVSLSGEILIAERTDPGWVPLFPAVSGILIERGSLLSHSAVVAREMGIPTIVGIRGLVKTVRAGDTVEMDGRSGTVKVL